MDFRQSIRRFGNGLCEIIEKTAIEEPIARGSIYAYAYISRHNDYEACLYITFGIIATEFLINLYKNKREV